MAMTPLVSLCIAFRNEQRHIARCIDSILGQDYANIELVAVDGASDDGSKQIVERYATQHPNIRLLHNPRVRSDYGFNVAIANARGDIIILVGGHSRLHPDVVSRSVRLLQETDADVVGGRINTTAATFIGTAIACVLSSPFGTGSRFRYSRREQLVDTVAFGAYRAVLFKEFGHFDVGKPKLDDLEFNRRLIKAGRKVLLHPAITVDYVCPDRIWVFLTKAARTGYFVMLHFLDNHNAVSPRHLVPALFVSCLCTLGLLLPHVSFVQTAFIGLAMLYAVLDVGFSIHATGMRHLLSLPLVVLLFPAHHVTYGTFSVVAILRRLTKLAIAGRWREAEVRRNGPPQRS